MRISQYSDKRRLKLICKTQLKAKLISTSLDNSEIKI